MVFVGAYDEGLPTGGDVTDDLLLQLADIKTDGNIVPPPTMTVEARTLAGARVAVLTAWPSDSPPVRYKGRIWIRVGPRRAHATAQDERILNEKRRHRDPHFDARRAPRAAWSTPATSGGRESSTIGIRSSPKRCACSAWCNGTGSASRRRAGSRRLLRQHPGARFLPAARADPAPPLAPHELYRGAPHILPFTPRSASSAPA